MTIDNTRKIDGIFWEKESFVIECNDFTAITDAVEMMGKRGEKKIKVVSIQSILGGEYKYMVKGYSLICKECDPVLNRVYPIEQRYAYLGIRAIPAALRKIREFINKQ